MAKTIKLIGCHRYTYGPKGEVFQRVDSRGAQLEYTVDDAKADLLLQSTNDKGMPYFSLVDPNAPKPRTRAAVIAEKKARVIHRRSMIGTKGKSERGTPAVVTDDEDTGSEPDTREEDDLEGVEL
jgi:protease II